MLERRRFPSRCPSRCRTYSNSPVLFVALAVAGTLAQEVNLGTLGFLTFSSAGGLVSSASTTATAAALAAAGKISPNNAVSMAAVLTSMASASVDVPKSFIARFETTCFLPVSGCVRAYPSGNGCHDVGPVGKSCDPTPGASSHPCPPTTRTMQVDYVPIW